MFKGEKTSLNSQYLIDIVFCFNLLLIGRINLLNL